MEQSIWQSLATGIIGNIIAGVVLLLIQYRVEQPVAGRKVWQRLMKSILLIFSLLTPVVIAKDLLVILLQFSPVSFDTRVELFAYLLIIISVTWGIIWSAFIRPRLLLLFAND